MINIELKPEYVLSVLGLNITNSFLTSLLVSLILIICALIFYSQRSNKKSQNIISKILTIFIFELLNFTDKITGDRELSKKILPLIATFFLFIVGANLLALIPGFLGSFFIKTTDGQQLPILRSPNSDLTTTLALAIISVVSIQYFSFKTLGAKMYIKRFIDFSGFIKFILGIFELMSETIKVLSFSFRLFGNIFAGEVLLLIIGFLVPYIIPLPFMLLEVFVGIIQAFIFAVLTLTFIKTSIARQEVEGAQNRQQT